MTANTKKGPTGLLTPEGGFQETEWGHHHEFANALLMQNDHDEDERYVMMGSKGVGEEAYSYLFVPTGKLTDPQKAWLEQNRESLDETQTELLQTHIEVFES